MFCLNDQLVVLSLDADLVRTELTDVETDSEDFRAIFHVVEHSLEIHLFQKILSSHSA